MIAPQFDFTDLISDRYSENQDRFPCKGDAYPCVICGRPCPNPKYMIWCHNGGNTAVTLAEGHRLNKSGHAGADLGMQPIGADCLRKNPQLRPYVDET